VAIDAARGLALWLMALEHVSFHAQVRTQAEHYAGRPTVLWKWPYWVTGLLTNPAALIFWFAAGVSVCLYAAGKRRSGASESSVRRYFCIRGLALITLDATVIAVIYGLSEGRLHAYEFDVLSSIGICLIAGTLLGRWPSWALAALGAGLIVGFAALRAAAHEIVGGPLPFGLALFFEYGKDGLVPVRFPLLGWSGLFVLGLAVGRQLPSPGLLRPRRWILVGAVLICAWLEIRAAGGYGNLVPYDPSQPWYYFLVLSKGPPSLAFITFNASLACFVFAAALSVPAASWERAPLRWLVVCGQASLCFYVAHYAVYLALARCVPGLSSLPGLVRYGLLYLCGLAILVPLTRAYRDLRKRHPESPLRYL
jgi:uncharacterized membrane protein